MSFTGLNDEELKDSLLLEIQKSFPLEAKPFEKIAQKFNVTEDKVLNILKEQKDAGIIRQTSAILDTKRLGYQSSLVAFKIEEKNIDKAVEILNTHPGISHNYERNHEFNIWFTLAVEPDSLFGLEKTVEILAKKTGAKDFIILPTIKLFKISVKLDTTNKEKKKEKVKKQNFQDIELTQKHIDILKEIQKDIDFVSEPFKNTIEKLNISYDEFFDMVQKMKNAGIMRRFAAILNHRKAGFNYNAMVVWDIDEDKIEEIGKKVASFSAVSHCYQRPKYPNWKYNLFSMIHAKSKEESEQIIEDIANEIEYNDKMPLYSTREFKKVRLKYFSDEFKEWERANA